jgi:hypothetical protein
MKDQTIQRTVGFSAGTRIGKLRDDRVFECGRRVADFSKAINSAGSRQAMRDTLDSIERARRPVAVLQRKPVL